MLGDLKNKSITVDISNNPEKKAEKNKYVACELLGKIPKCGSCEMPYDLQDNSPRVLNCGHTMCQMCIEESKKARISHCPICHKQTNIHRLTPVTVLPQNMEITEYIKHLTQLVEGKWVLLEQNKALAMTKTEYLQIHLNNTQTYEKRIDDLEKELNKQKNLAKMETMINCSECGVLDNEKNIHLCQECCQEKLNLDVSKIENITTETDVHSVAICSTCCIRKHLSNSHKIIDFFPVLRQKMYLLYQETWKKSRKQLLKATHQLRDLIETSFKLIKNGSAELNEMTEVVQNSSSSFEMTNRANEVNRQIDLMCQFINDFRADEIVERFQSKYADISTNKRKAEIKQENDHPPANKLIKLENEKTE